MRFLISKLNFFFIKPFFESISDIKSKIDAELRLGNNINKHDSLSHKITDFKQYTLGW
jgi:hypothetical protein